jgi:leader peptidase (prepilin peptidase)/N-methyltransferase
MNSELVTSLPPWFVIGLSALLGLSVGSFLNVVVSRIPFALSIIKPGSRCPDCAAPIAWHDNIPIISYLILRGKCRECRKHISLLYPTIEILTATLFALIVWIHGPTLRSLGEWWFVSVMIAFMFIDARHHILPDRLTFPSLPLAIAFAMTRIPILAELDPMLEVGPSGFSRWRAALLGAGIILFSAFAFWLLDLLDSLLFSKYYHDEEAETEAASAVLDLQYARTNRLTQVIGSSLALIWLLAVLIDSPRDPGLYEMLFGRVASAALSAMIAASLLWFLRAGYFYLRGIEGMGLGDVKLMAVTGAFLGWPPAIMVLLIASLFGIAVGVVMARRSGAGLRTELPLGACIGAAGILATLILDLSLYP